MIANPSNERVFAEVMHRLPAVTRLWAAPCVAEIDRLLGLAKDSKISDAEFARELEDAIKRIPDLFDAMDPSALSFLMESAMGAAAVNGFVAGRKARGDL